MNERKEVRRSERLKRKAETNSITGSEPSSAKKSRETNTGNETVAEKKEGKENPLVDGEKERKKDSDDGGKERKKDPDDGGRGERGRRCKELVVERTIQMGWICRLTAKPIKKFCCLYGTGEVYEESALKEWIKKYPNAKFSPSGASLRTKAYGSIYALRHHLDSGLFSWELGCSDAKDPSTWSPVMTCPITREEMKQATLIVPKCDRWKEFDEIAAPHDYTSIVLLWNTQWARWEDCHHFMPFLSLKDQGRCDLNDQVMLIPARFLTNNKCDDHLPYPKLKIRPPAPKYDPTTVSRDPTIDAPLVHWENGSESNEIESNVRLSRLASKSDADHRTTIRNAFFRNTVIDIHGKLLTWENCLFVNCTFRGICWCGMTMRLCRFVQCTFDDNQARDGRRLFNDEFVSCTIRARDAESAGAMQMMLAGIQPDEMTREQLDENLKTHVPPCKSDSK